MAGDDDPKEFPDVSHKLSAPKKLSAFERERQAAEQKRRRAEAENEAALKEFEDAMLGDDGGQNDDFDGFPRFPNAPSGPRNFGTGYGGPPGRYGGPPRGGPGSLGPVPRPPPSLKKKRALEEMREEREARRDHEDFTAEYLGRRDGHGHYSSEPREEELHDDIISRPTIQLSNLPPSSTDLSVKVLLRPYVQVYSVQLQPPPGRFSTERRSLTAVAQLPVDTSSATIEAAVSALRDKYLGWGYRLSISRHLSSTSLHPNPTLPVLGSSAEPFGAQKIDRDQPRIGNLRNAPPPDQFAPPDSFNTRTQHAVPANAYVVVEPPADVHLMRAIHVIVDRLLGEPNTGRALQIEALLMAQPEIQHDENFAFLYDSRSPGGAYYRFLLWTENALDIIQARKDSARGPERVVDDVVLDWVPPAGKVPFADLTGLGEVLDHVNYPSDNESDLDEAEDGGEQRQESDENIPFTALQIAKLSWLLSKMPTSTKELRIGHVAAVTSSAIRHARLAAEEIVNMLVLNIEKPYAFTSCARSDDEDVVQNEDDDYEPDQELPTIEATPVTEAGVGKPEPDDPSEIKFVALYLINDILQNCATAKNAWRYRVLFENAFKQRKVFQHIAQVPKEAGWGRLREEKWRRRIEALIDIWKQKNIFASDSFMIFENAVKDQFDGNDASKTDSKKKSEDRLLGRFKRIDGVAVSPSASASPAPPVQAPGSQYSAAETSGLDGEPMEDLDGEPMDDLDGVPMDDLDGAPMDDLDGTPMADLDGEPMGDLDRDDVKDQLMDDAPAPTEPSQNPPLATGSKTSGFSIKGSSSSQPPAAQVQKRRKLAEDMFADSDEE
ncbi:hypothetical protein PRZ48_012857 [Zasmidium cellare]|uniref:CID domain-containing protein n=1 Tax=Zasmidium cellare TaxID=395010 RepID=A0ABR0E2E0_ZASCE|nr:hypothetical protein PRZ48_012857 [Zasmidium cellare]